MNHHQIYIRDSFVLKDIPVLLFEMNEVALLSERNIIDNLKYT